MSRKTEEIKIRLTPDEKSRWQQLAEGDSVSVSELIRSRLNERVSAASMTGPPPVPSGPTASGSFRNIPIPIVPAATPTEDVPTSAEVGPNEERRSEPCVHGKATWLYCGTCDG